MGDVQGDALKTIFSLLMFVSGFVSNLACQILRALFNALGFIILVVFGLLGLTVGLLRLAGGGKEKGFALCSSSWITLRISARMALKAVAQAAGSLSMVTPLLRAAQASSEPFGMNGVYAPASPNRMPIQGLFGLNSWTVSSIKVVPSNTTVSENRPMPVVGKKVENAPNIRIFEPARPKKSRSAVSSERDWEQLARKYLDARTRAEADRVRIEMAMRHPVKYLKVLHAMRSIKKAG